MHAANAGFTIAAFACDGELVGTGFWDFSEFDQGTLDDAAEFLRRHGSVFDATGTGERSAVRTKFTSASGAAIATVFCRIEIASSLLILSGRFPESEQTVMRMFADSVARSSLGLQAEESSTPFAAIRTLEERPLVVVVTWPMNNVTDDEERLIRSHGLYTAGAFLRTVSSDEP